MLKYNHIFTQCPSYPKFWKTMREYVCRAWKHSSFLHCAKTEIPLSSRHVHMLSEWNRWSRVCQTADQNETMGTGQTNACPQTNNNNKKPGKRCPSHDHIPKMCTQDWLTLWTDVNSSSMNYLSHEVMISGYQDKPPPPLPHTHSEWWCPSFPHWPQEFDSLTG